MINNRQGGRRRGRGGQRPQGMPGNSGNNARDNRQRGNAAQLLEKYKSMARDAQLAGDRVQTEYFLQFADHYFRVLEDGRSRFEEQQPQQRGRGRDDEDGDDGDEYDADIGEDDGELRQQPQQQQQQPRQQQRQRPDRDDDRDERPRAAREDDRGERPDRDERPARVERPRRERANGRDERPAESEQRIAAAVLPPAIRGEADDDAPAEARPRRRLRKARDGDDGDIAPAA